MLVLGRKLNECIVLDCGIRICVVEVGFGKVKLGIDAPDDVKIMRSELIGRDGGAKEDRR